MTGRDRILAVLQGELPDRVPVSLYKIDPFDNTTFWAQHASFNRLLEIARNLQDTFHFYRPKTGFFFSAPDAIPVEVEETKDSPISTTVRLTVRTGAGILTRSARTTRMSTLQWVQKPWIENHRDIEKFLALPYVQFDPDISDLPGIRNNLGDRGVIVIALPNPLGVIGTLFAAGDFPKFEREYPALIRQLLDKIYERLQNLYRFYSTRVSNVIIRIRGAEYATPPTLPEEHRHDARRIFSDFVLKYDRELFDILRRGNPNRICYHWHDHIDELLPQVLRMEPDILEPICNSGEFPQAIARIRKLAGNRIVIMGGVEAYDLEFRSSFEVTKMIREALQQGARSGRFILIPSNVPVSTPLAAEMEDNYITFLEAGVREGRYPLR